MKKMRYRTIYKASILIILVLVVSSVLYAYSYTNKLNNINVDISKLANNVTYGSNIKLGDLIKHNGKIIKSDKIDTKKVGKQVISVLIKNDNAVKEVPVVVNVVDREAPSIVLQSDTVYTDFGVAYDLSTNIKLVHDNNDGDLGLNNNCDKGCYKIEGNYDFNKSGTYTIKVVAIDNSGNTNSAQFNLIVKEKKVYNPIVVNSVANPSASTIVEVARSLVGSPYRGGGNTPAGFDCSGFAQYVYKMNGKNISRSASTQANDGIGISYDDIMPGDLIIWGENGYFSHTSIYIGNGLMVHSANPSAGVIISNVSAWDRGSSSYIARVRRIV